MFNVSMPMNEIVMHLAEEGVVNSDQLMMTVREQGMMQMASQKLKFANHLPSLNITPV